MKTLKFFTDTETTGTLRGVEQILSFSVVLENQEKTLSAYEKTTRLKPNVIPNPKALLVNRINPFTENWKKQAYTEYDAYQEIKKISLDAQEQGYRILLIAYNAEFDREKFEELFARFGDDFNKYFPLIFDPLPMARKLLLDKVFTTKWVQLSLDEGYMSAKLEDVYIGLGYDSSNLKAHTALDDTLMLQVVTHGLYFLATGHKLEEMNASPENFVVGKTYHVVVEGEKQGLVKKHFRVLFNDPSMNRVLILDEEKARSQGPELVVDWLSYNEIFDELPVDKTVEEKIEIFMTLHSATITTVASSILNKKEKVVKSTKLDFAEVEKLANKMMNSPDVKAEFISLTEDELEILPQAEAFAAGKYEKVWSPILYGPDFATVTSKVQLRPDVAVILDPVGNFILEAAGELVLTTAKKTELQEKMLKDYFEGNRESLEYKEWMKKLPSVNHFKNIKHPREVILKEFDEIKGEIFNGADKEKKDILTDFLTYCKAFAPSVFGEVNLPSFKLDLSSFLKKKT